jgi:hypothetical protein
MNPCDLVGQTAAAMNELLQLTGPKRPDLEPIFCLEYHTAASTLQCQAHVSIGSIKAIFPEIRIY